MVVKKSLFREKTLARLSSPEDLSQLVRVIGPQEWWWLGTLGALVLGVTFWSIFGRIPITTTGRAILLIGDRENVARVRTQIGGRLVNFSVGVGDEIEVGQAIAEIDLPELELELRQEQQTLGYLQETFERTQQLFSEENRIQNALRSQEQQLYREQIVQEEKLSQRLREETRISINNQLQSNKQEALRLQTLASSLQDEFNRLGALRREGSVSESYVLDKEQQLVNVLAQIDNLTNQNDSLILQRINSEKDYRDSQDKILGLQVKMTGLQNQKVQATLEQEETLSAQTQKIEQSRDRIQALQSKLANQSIIRSSYDGTVLSLEAQEFDLLAADASVIVLDRSLGTEGLTGFAYFSIANGKRIAPEMKVQITPDNVERSKDGGILGRVVTVGSYPFSQETVNTRVGSAELGKALTLSGPAIEAEIVLEGSAANPSGYAWSSGKGPDLRITHGTTASVLVAVEERAPITFVIPLLRKLSGLD